VVAPESLVELEAARPVFLDVRRLASDTLLSEGRAIRALEVAAFVGIRGMGLLLDALHIEPWCGEPSIVLASVDRARRPRYR